MPEEGIYHGRLETDGNGNLLATDDGGKPVAYHDGSFIYLNPGDPSHNERHEQQKLEPTTGTVDQSMTDDTSLVNAYEGGDNAHHFEPAPADPMPVDPDAVAAKITSHTDAWS
jgi:hypothetical protein